MRAYNSSPLLILILVIAVFFGCTKEEMLVVETPYRANEVSSPKSFTAVSGLARYAGSDYSQSISVDQANSMISSYHASIGYPTKDTAIRSFAFDADTLRAYLANPSIVTLRFYVAHTPSYISNPATKDHYAGLTPGAVTLVLAGLDNSDAVVRNSQNEVYDHMIACPLVCKGTSSALIQ